MSKFKVGDYVVRKFSDFGTFYSESERCGKKQVGPKVGDVHRISNVDPYSGVWLQLEGYDYGSYDQFPFNSGAFDLHYEHIRPIEPKQPSLGTNPKDLIGSKKVPLHSVPPASLIYQALGMSDGRVKYGDYNWRKNKVIASIYIDATLRHLASWLDGEENAEDSKKPHLGHALANIGIIVDALETGNLVDDRPTPGIASKLLAKWEIKKDEKKESA